MRHLPVLTERAVGSIRAKLEQIGDDFRRPLGAVTCKDKCAACCHYPLVVTLAEGRIIASWLEQHGRVTTKLKSSLAEHRDSVQGLAPEVWLLAKVPCPFLTDSKSCSIYPVRPLGCRLVWSSMPASFCQPEEGHVPFLGDRMRPFVEFVDFQKTALRGHPLGVAGASISYAVLDAL